MKSQQHWSQKERKTEIDEIAELKNRLDKLYEDISRDERYRIRPSFGEGEVLFKKPLKIPFLVIKSLYDIIHIIDTVDTKLKSLKYSPVKVSLELDIGRKHIEIKLPPVVGFAYLFLPDALKEIRHGEAEIRGSESFKDFIDIAIDFTTTLTRTGKINMVDYSDLFPKYKFQYMNILIQYPGLNFDLVGISHDPGRKASLIMYTISERNSILTIFRRVLEVELLRYKRYKKDNSLRLIPHLVEKSPVFREVLTTIKERAPKIVETYRRNVILAYFGLKAYEV